jgi:hypothetical protein
MITEQQLNVVIGCTAVGPDGTLGTVCEVYLDDATHRPEWAALRIGLLGTRDAFVPLARAEISGDDLWVPYDEDTVANAPRIDSEGYLSPADEIELYRYYGLSAGFDSAAPVPDTARGAVVDDAPGPTTDVATTRFEKHLLVGAQPIESRRPPLRRYVVTENVTRAVPDSHEEIRLEREPIADANVGDTLDGPALSEEEYEVVLHAERPVVAAGAVPVELDTDDVPPRRAPSPGAP